MVRLEYFVIRIYRNRIKGGVFRLPEELMRLQPSQLRDSSL
jgi:hypothetical protein